MGYFSKILTALYCTVQFLLSIFILSISEVLEMLVLSSEHVYTNAPHASLIVSVCLKQLCLVLQ